MKLTKVQVETLQLLATNGPLESTAHGDGHRWISGATAAALNRQGLVERVPGGHAWRLTTTGWVTRLPKDQLAAAHKPKQKSLGLTAEEVKTQLFAVFSDWMDGQTVAVDPKTGAELYYRHDVSRFIDAMRARSPRVFD